MDTTKKPELEFENGEGFADEEMRDEEGNDIPIEEIESSNQIDFDKTTLNNVSGIFEAHFRALENILSWI